jgi:integrase
MYRFTEISIESLPTPATGRKDYWERPLGVRVTSKGTKSYMVLLRSGERKMLGRVGIIPLKEARTIALRLKADYQPTKYKAPPVTVSEARTTYLAAIQIRPATRRYYERYLALLPEMPLINVEHTHILHILDRLPPQTRQLALYTYSAFFRWAIPRWLKYSPCTGLKAPKTLPRTRVLSDEELKLIFLACDNLGEFGILIQLCILLGLRRGEASCIRPEFLDLSSRTLVLPAALVKNKKDHSMPFGDLSMQRLIKSPFSSQAWSNNIAKLRDTVGFGDFCIHTLRHHTYRSNLARIGVAPHIAERLVGHVSSRSQIERIYDHFSYEPECRSAQENMNNFSWKKSLGNHAAITD